MTTIPNPGDHPLRPPDCEPHEEGPSQEARRQTFTEELTTLLNRQCVENDSDTPDFILAQYLLDTLGAWNRGVAARERWYGRKLNGLPGPMGPA